ncbi:hypothetical protein NIES19_22810 [Anabaena cylindrica PCC 7122]|nr:hypothetical protein NIES19_22810 [Anabaena cylindrica PCC 7122]
MIHLCNLEFSNAFQPLFPLFQGYCADALMRIMSAEQRIFFQSWIGFGKAANEYEFFLAKL